MLNTVYRLTASRTIEPVVVSQDTTGKVIVRPTYLSICNADQRYYQGTRSKEVLAKKLPMALIHEGIGRVVSDSTGVFQPGDVVVMLPNAPPSRMNLSLRTTCGPAGSAAAVSTGSCRRA